MSTTPDIIEVTVVAQDLRVGDLFRLPRNHSAGSVCKVRTIRLTGKNVIINEHGGKVVYARGRTINSVRREV